MKRSILVLSTLLVAACGPSGSGPGSAARPGATPTAAAGAPSPAAAPSASPAGPLFVVLESSQQNHVPDTIAIVGLDGVARAKTRFKPRLSGPWVLPDLGALPPVAHVAAGRAYFVDGDGVVRSLGVDGGIRQETRFPVTSGQQEVSFAVSPNGHDLVGSVVTLPPEPDPPPTPGWFPSTPYAMDVMTATAGSAATVAYHRTWMYHDNLGSGAQFVAWDTAGPVATWPSTLGTQGGGPHQWNGVALVHFSGGRPGAAVPAPGGCYPMDLLATGVFVCGAGDRTVSVLGPNGAAVWHATATDPSAGLLYAFLSPDGRRVVSFGMSSSAVYSPSDPPVALPAGFYHSGWIDARTVAGTITAGDFAYVSLDAPGRAVDLGFKGQFVGGLLT